MFGNKNETEKNRGGKNVAGPTGNLSTISVGTHIKGEISSEGDIRVEGFVEGTVKTKSKVAVGQSGKMEGDIICRDADIQGKVNGTLQVSNLLFIREHAVVDGDITTSKLVIENGARFNGTIKMTAKSSQAPMSSGQNNGKSQGQPFKKKQAV